MEDEREEGEVRISEVIPQSSKKQRDPYKEKLLKQFEKLKMERSKLKKVVLGYKNKIRVLKIRLKDLGEDPEGTVEHPTRHVKPRLKEIPIPNGVFKSSPVLKEMHYAFRNKHKHLKYDSEIFVKFATDLYMFSPLVYKFLLHEFGTVLPARNRIMSMCADRLDAEKDEDN